MFRPLPSVLFPLALFGLGAPPAVAAPPDAARLLRHVAELAGTIGPRPSGSAAEERAVEYIRREMEAAGLEVTVQEVTRLEEEDGERALRTWNVLGRLAGQTEDTIVIAAHHDSRSTLVPGANDDASGIAVLLEVARATAARPRRDNYLFASFGAEEDGLAGSRRFAADADLGRVRAAVALELVGRGELLVAPVPEPPPLWAQQALLRAGRETGASGIAARPLWTLVPRFLPLPFSADHEPFLRRGVPAFLLLGTYPAWTYHTSEDTAERIDEAALLRTATVLDRLLSDLDAAPPAPGGDRHYLPFTFFGRGLILPGAALAAFAWTALAGAALLALVRLRALLAWRAITDLLRVLVVTGASTALGLAGLLASPALMQQVHQARFPWMAHQGLHLCQALAFTLVTGWLGLRLFRLSKPTIEPGPYLAGAVLLPLASVAACLWLGRPEVAALPAAAVVAFLASLLTRSTPRKLALGLLGALPFFSILTLEDYRAAVELGGIVLPPRAAFTALLLLVLPFALFVAHVACFQDCLQSPVWRRLSRGWVAATGLFLSASLLAVTSGLPAYDASHRAVVSVLQSVDLEERRAQVTLRSLERLRGVALDGAGSASLDGALTVARISLPFPEDRVRFEASAATRPEGDATAVSCALGLVAPRVPAETSARFTSRSGFRVPGRGDRLRHSYTFSEAALPKDPERRYDLLLPAGGDLAVAFTAEFDGDLLGVRPVGSGRVFVERGRITASRSLLGEAHPAPPAVPDATR